jgi:hypothetical protein
MDAVAHAVCGARGTLSASLNLRKRRELCCGLYLRQHPRTNSNRCPGHFASIDSKLLRVETLVDLLVCVVSDTAEMVIGSQFKLRERQFQLTT